MAARHIARIAGCALLALSAPVRADQLRLAVASNFRSAMQAVAAQFEQRSQGRVTLIFGSTGKQFAQVRNGAPFDAFFAADAERPSRLEAEGRIVPGSRFTYAIGALVLWSPRADLVDPEGLVLDSDRFDHLAMANPDLAPYGAAAREVLRSLGLWQRLEPRVVRGENIAQAYQFVVSGNAQLGFVARSQLVFPGAEPRGSAWQPPQSLYPRIEQQAVLLRDTNAARAFMAFMRSDEARALIGAYGYDLP
jgi:molybdate transport system substrate-binding protein